MISDRQRAFAAWADRVERWLKRAVWWLAILLILSQLLLQFPEVRTALTGTARWEGVPFAPAAR